MLHCGLQNNNDGTVTVAAGLKLWQLYQQLDAIGLAMPNSGTQCTQTIAGVMATATHGTGNTGSMASQIRGFRIVLANGNTVTASATQNVDLYNTARVGYGALGVITAYTLAVVPQFKLERIVIGPFPIADIKGYMDKFRQMYDGRASFTYYPYANDNPNNAIIILYVPTNAAITSGGGCWQPGPFGTPVTPAPTNVYPSGQWPAGTNGCVDISYKAMVLQGGTFEGCPNAYGTAMEMIVPEANVYDVLNEFMAYENSVRNQYDANKGILGQTDVRFVAADNIWLSPYNGRTAAVLSVSIIGEENTQYTGDPAQIARYLRDGLQRIALQYNGRPHPGKQSYFDANLMKSVYPNYCDFVQTRYTYDPNGVFTNPWLETLFNPHQQQVNPDGSTTPMCICPTKAVCASQVSQAPTPAASVAPGGATTLSMTRFPAPGTLTPLAGKFTGFPGGAHASDYKVILYLQGAGGGANNWWVKPQPNAAAIVNNDGTWTIENWASYPQGDVNFASFEVYLVPLSQAVPNGTHDMLL
jgi:hypothetical protein